MEKKTTKSKATKKAMTKKKRKKVTAQTQIIETELENDEVVSELDELNELERKIENNNDKWEIGDSISILSNRLETAIQEFSFKKDDDKRKDSREIIHSILDDILDLLEGEV